MRPARARPARADFTLGIGSSKNYLKKSAKNLLTWPPDSAIMGLPDEARKELIV